MRHSVLPVACALGLALSGACGAQHRVDSLGEVPGVLETPEAIAIWRTEMEGRPGPDRLGTTDIAGFDRRQLLEALMPGVVAEGVHLLGARPWPQRPGHFVALLCVGDSIEHGAPRYEQDCDTSVSQAILGVLRIEDGRPHAVATLALDDDAGLPRLDWSAGDAPQAVDPENPDPVPQRWESFDLAPYTLRHGAAAFGLRAGWSEGYAGGGAFFSALYLFDLQGDALVPVFATQMSMYRDLAGDWNEDGTRQHHIDEWARIVIVQPKTRHGYHDLLVRERGARGGGVVYAWSPEARRYAPASPPRTR
ncbi:hypothetical protein H0E84_04235 [Luteimonas sp. SJ-92]|uniref:Uncharacterized protein n=1 Tax=Luteimonas salinisoli TaxID=2752307 RepID=A0A853J8V7_9GAMM|nr:hypothetical protein [Luteimonas salinisoli]NZA25581.1 hypothetical protein [Luteimonas salinisoli]